MMLSVLIPVYNEDAQPLVARVLEQVSALHADAEVVVGDDGSTAHTAWLDTVASWPNVRVCRNNCNLGRAANRNNLARMARGEWLLFIDSGNDIADDGFLQKYLGARNMGDIVVGGVDIGRDTYSDACSLRWLYEHAAAKAWRKAMDEHRSLSTYPFRSAAFMVRRTVMEALAFDETLRGYGYEDVLFGIEARQRGYGIAHVCAPVMLGHLEDNATFLAKTEEALATLHTLSRRIDRHSRLLRHVALVNTLHLTPLVRGAYAIMRNALRRNLLSHKPSLRCFAFYKLGYYLSL